MQKLFPVLFCWFFGLGCCFGQGSVLREGPWLKIGVVRDGIYKLDAAALRRAGWNPGQINPALLQLYGNGGDVLPQNLSAARPVDLRENAIQVTGENDGRFDDQDAILFYGASPHKIRLDTLQGIFSHALHPYTDTTYYFLTVGTAAGKRVGALPTATPTQTLTAYDDYLYHESEQSNRVASGRTWYGESYYVLSERSFPFTVPSLPANTPFILTSATMGYASVQTRFDLKVNGIAVGSQPIPAVTYDRYDYKGVDAANRFTGVLPAGNSVSVTVSYDRNGDNAAQGLLNYLGLQLRRPLAWNGEAFRFRSLDGKSAGGLQWQITGAPASLAVWDITSTIRQAGITNGAFSYQPGGIIHEFFAFMPDQAQAPASLRLLPNQNLRSTATPDLLIVTAQAYRAQANRLAAFRRQHDALTTLVVTTDEVFNEFSSGQADPSAIQDFARLLSQKGKLRFLLLFGDATYDYKNVLGENQAAGYVPTYESRESLHPIYSYSSDDYFGFLKDGEGDWPEDYTGDYALDLGVGRLPVKTVAEATDVVDKLIRYEDSRGTWQSRLAFVADDGDYNIHVQDADRLASGLDTLAYQADKIYLDAYPQTGSGTDQKSPKASTALNQAVRDGHLILSFAGHGGVSGWTQEQILSLKDILGWRNRDRLPLFLTATCEFGRYDDPGVVSGAELTLLNAQGGGIGLLTTARPVFASSNFLVSDAFMKAVFRRLDDGTRPRLGDLIRITKNNSLSGRVNRNFTLLGDPSMHLAYPDEEVQVHVTDTLKAGAVATVSGTVPFDGTAWIEVADQPAVLKTLGDESQPFSYTIRNSVLFSGSVPVTSGRFSTSFVVPVSMAAGSGKARVRVFAWKSDSTTTALGVAFPATGGTSVNPVKDTTPPVIAAVLNDDNFRDGDVTDPNPLLLVSVSDNTGISLTQAQPLTVVLNDTLTLTLNDRYTPATDKSGKASYPFRSLPQGNHRLLVRAYDVLGNQAEKMMHFSVQPYTKASLRNVTAMPNPFRERVRFSFNHDFPDEDTDIDLYLYDLTGRLIRHQHLQSFATPSPFEELTLENPELPTGLYIYRIFVRADSTGKLLSGSGKLSHIN